MYNSLLHLMFPSIFSNLKFSIAEFVGLMLIYFTYLSKSNIQIYFASCVAFLVPLFLCRLVFSKSMIFMKSVEPTIKWFRTGLGWLLKWICFIDSQFGKSSPYQIQLGPTSNPFKLKFLKDQDKKIHQEKAFNL